MDGKNWFDIEKSKIFDYKLNGNLIEEFSFQKPVYARTIRIKPIAWRENIALRFESFFIE